MQRLKIALCAVVGSAAFGATAMAQDDGPTVAFNVGATTDYLFRGLSQNGFDPAAFAGADVSKGIVYGGVWSSGVGFADAEVDLYAGVKPAVGPVTFDFGAIYYGYVKERVPGQAAYWEGKAAATVAAGPGAVGAAIYYSPEFFGETGKATYYELNAAFPVRKATFSAAVGQQSLKSQYYGVKDYATWNAGVTYPVTDAVSLDVRYVATDKDAVVAGAGSAADKFVATLKATF